MENRLLVPVLAATLASGCVSKKKYEAGMAALRLEMEQMKVDTDLAMDVDANTTLGRSDVARFSSSIACPDSIPRFEKNHDVAYGDAIPANVLYGLYGVAPVGVDFEVNRDSGATRLAVENAKAEGERRPCTYSIVRTDEIVRTTEFGDRPLDPHLLLDPNLAPVGEMSVFATVTMLPAGWTDGAELAHWCLDNPDVEITSDDPAWNPTEVTAVANGNPKWRMPVYCTPDEEGGFAVVLGYRTDAEGDADGGSEPQDWQEIGRRVFNAVEVSTEGAPR